MCLCVHVLVGACMPWHIVDVTKNVAYLFCPLPCLRQGLKPVVVLYFLSCELLEVCLHLPFCHRSTGITYAALPGFKYVLDTQIQVFTLSQQARYSLDYLPA